ncbi:MAG: excinuclease ABC subunit UvrA [Planctomycetota bacterium]|jgi:excinuclease ABC subunit A
MARGRKIVIRGAREHNLKNVDLDLPREKLVVITGVSGSGKSSLAFDTLYAEGQRRYVESLSAYARQFLEQMKKPDVESITGLPPTISIEQRKSAANPRSTVATTTEIYDYLRLLYARVGTVHCPVCDKPLRRSSPQAVVDAVLDLPAGTRIQILAGIVRGRKGEHRDVFARIAAEGFVRVRVDGKEVRLPPAPSLDKNRAHSLEVVVDRLKVKKRLKTRIRDSVETALRLGNGTVILSRTEGGKTIDQVMSDTFLCETDGVSFEAFTPRMFSFNSPWGACPHCAGLGTRMELDPDLIVPDPERTLEEGAIEPWRGHRTGMFYGRAVRSFARVFKVDLFTPFRNLPKEIRRILLTGTKPRDERRYGRAFEGVIPNLMRRFQNTQSEYVKRRIHGYMNESPCPECEGARLKPASRAVRVGKVRIHDVVRMSISEAERHFQKLRFDKEARRIAAPILKEIRSRLRFMEEVGLDYLTLDRRAASLSGGEAQRIRLATQVGSALVGVCYVLDEPTIGLHARDNERLLRSLRRLCDAKNSVLVVEHDPDTIHAADFVVDMGPGAGVHGGEVVSVGTVAQVSRDRRSVTGAFLRGERGIPIPKRRRSLVPDRGIRVRGASENNLKNITVRIPLGGIVAVTGVSGSGKSTLVVEVLLKALRRKMHGARAKPGAHRAVGGDEQLDKVVEIDQSPIGRTPRSNPATYTKVFGEIRALFALVKEARIRGYAPGRFSFNVPGGRCEACEGAGTRRIEMHFLPDVFVPCEECGGTRYNRETLDIRYKGKNIMEILRMSVEEALAFFERYPKIQRILGTLNDVGLGYIRLGQPATTLSGGEAQRVKLSSELGRPAYGHALYVLDEPTTGLHAADIEKLLLVLQRLVDQGNSVLVIEHNLDVIKTADWIVDLGPEGGERGGRVVAQGPPEKVVRVKSSFTGRALIKVLQSGKGAGARKRARKPKSRAG